MRPTAFSKKIENHFAVVAIHAVHYNLVRIHKTLRITPAKAAGITDHVWSLEENGGVAGDTMKNHLAAVGIGMCFGGVLGLLLHNLLIGICIGAALGVAYEKRNRNLN